MKDKTLSTGLESLEVRSVTNDGFEETGFQQPFFIVSWVEFGLSLVLFHIRWYTCQKILHRTGNDFYVASATLVVGTASMAMLTVGAAHGLGLPRSHLTPEDILSALLFGWVNQVLALVAIGLSKIAIVVFLLRIEGFHTLTRTFFLWFIAGSNLAVNCIAAILALVQCSPIQKLWNEGIPGECSARKRVQIFGYVQGSWSAFVDIALAMYPMLLFWGVEAFTTRTKVGLCALMGVGISAAICASFKSARLSLLTKTADETYTLAQVIIWNQSEMWVLFIVSCIPPTKVFFRLAVQKVASSINVGKNRAVHLQSHNEPRGPNV